MTFNFQERIRGYLSSKPANEIFDALMQDVEFYFNRSCSDMQALKLRENKKLKGDLWENFCKQWLLASNSSPTGIRNLGKYTHVYLFAELTPEIKQFLRLPAKQDEGIDIIAFMGDILHPVAIQCKYRGSGVQNRDPLLRAKGGATRKLVSWKTLSTFVGLCAVTGLAVEYRYNLADKNHGYVKTIVMTNCNGVTRKVKTPTDASICCGTFRNTSSDVWMKMAGIYEPKKIAVVPEAKPKTIEDLRQKRLEYYSSLSPPSSPSSPSSLKEEGSRRETGKEEGSRRETGKEQGKQEEKKKN